MTRLSPIGNTSTKTGIGGTRSGSIHRRHVISRVLLSIGALIVSLTIAEGALRLVERSQLGDRRIEHRLVADPLLGYKLEPFTAGHDANGFRNDSVPQHVDVVVLGDSQSWGVNAERQDAWPQQLSKLSGHSVYNMSMGGFGPIQYRLLLPQALPLSPKIVVVGLYLGNDVYDAYHLAYQYHAHRDLRSNAAGDLSVDTVGIKANAFWNEEKQFHNTFGRASLSGLSFWLREHLAIGRLLNRTKLWPGAQDVDYEIDKQWALTYPDHGAVCDVPGQETIFTTAYRLAGMDIDEPRNAEGLRITKDLLGQLQTELDAKQVKLILLLLPTKETVYATARSGKISLNSSYQKLVQMEERIRSEIISTCQAKRIQSIDARPYLNSALNRGERLYPMSTESHPNARGYLVIAAAVNENLGQLGR